MTTRALGRWLYHKRGRIERWCYQCYEVTPFVWLGRLVGRSFRFLDRYRPPPGPPLRMDDLQRYLNESYSLILTQQSDEHAFLMQVFGEDK